MKLICIIVGLISGVFACYGQSGHLGPLADRQTAHFDHWVMMFTQMEPYPVLAKKFEDGLILDFGLDSKEAASLRAMAQEARTEMKRIAQSVAPLLATKGVRSPEANASLAVAGQQKLQFVTNFGVRFLASVRPEIAARIRARINDPALKALPGGIGK